MLGAGGGCSGVTGIGARRVPAPARPHRAARPARVAGARWRCSGLVGRGADRGRAEPVRRGDGVPLRRGRGGPGAGRAGGRCCSTRPEHSYVDLADPKHLEFAYTQVDRRGGRRGRAGRAAAGRAAPGRRRVHHAAVPGRHPAGHATTWCSRSTAGWSSWTSASWACAPGPELRAVVGDARMLVAGEPPRQPGPGGRRRVRAPGGAVAPGHPGDGRRRSGGCSAPAGVYVQNVIDYPPLRFIRAEVATVAAEFRARRADRPAERAGRRARARTSSSSPRTRRCRWTRSGHRLGRGRPSRSACSSGAELADFVGDALVLTDDYAPVDQLLATA